MSAQDEIKLPNDDVCEEINHCINAGESISESVAARALGEIAALRAALTAATTRAVLSTQQSKGDTQNGAGATTRALSYADVLFLVEEVRRLEKMALDDDNYRCESCERVFPVDEIVFGEDCEICINCVKEIAEANA